MAYLPGSTRANRIGTEFDPALRLTRSCAERAPRLVACLIHLAIAARDLGLEDEARGAARRLLEIYPRDSQLQGTCGSFRSASTMTPPSSSNTCAALACRSDPRSLMGTVGGVQLPASRDAPRSRPGQRCLTSCRRAPRRPQTPRTPCPASWCCGAMARPALPTPRSPKRA